MSKKRTHKKGHSRARLVPSAGDKRILSRSAVESYSAILLAIIPWALTERGVEVNAWMAGILFFISFCLAADFIWRSPMTAPLRTQWRVGGIVALAAGEVFVWTITNLPGVTIQPEGEFVLSTGEWSQKTTLVITNERAVPLYSVRIKIWTDTPGVPSESIKVEPDQNVVTQPLKYGNQEVPADAMAWDYQDASGRESVCVGFQEIPAHQARRLLVYGEPQKASVGQAAVAGYNSKPERLWEKPDRVHLEMEVCETGRIKGAARLLSSVLPKK